MRRSPQRRNLLTGFIISLLFVSFFIVYSIANMRIVQRERIKVDASLRSLRILEDLMDDMQDIESGQRGYIISGQPEYLAPYRIAAADLARDSIALKSLYALYPDRVPVYDRLLAHVFRKKDLAAANIYLKDNQAGDSALRLIRSGAGRMVMDSIRTIITALDQQDHAMLLQANEKRAKAARATALVFIGMSLLFISGLFIFYFRLRRESRIRKESEQFLQRFNEELAQQVEEKTLQLSQNIRQLRASNERFEMITRTTNDAVWEWNLETGELWGNETHQQLYGLQPDDPVPTEEEWLSRIHPDDRSGMIHKQEKALTSDANVFITEYRFNTVERGYRNIYDRCYIVRNAENKAIRILGSMMDITERKQTELALQQSEENYRSMIEQASDGIFIMDGEGRYVDTNTAACALVGYSREEMKGMTAVDLLTPGNIPVPQLKKKELQQGETVILERTLLRKDGGTVDAEVSYKLLSNGNILAIARDITEKKKADEEIVRSNARFQLLSKATSDIVWDWDMREERIWWNDNYYSLLGLTRTMDMEPIDEWYKRIHPDDVERVRADVQQGIRNHTSFYSHEYRFARADGTYLHFLDRTFILWGGDDQPHRMIGSMVNMTPIYEAQRVVAESENRLRTIINSEPQCIKLLDRSGNLLDMNPAGLAMIEADSLEQVKGHLVAAIVDKEYRPGFIRLIEDVFSGRSGSLLFSVTGLKGTSRWLETHAVPMKDAAGRIIALLGVTMDVTDKRKAEEELKRNEEKYRTLVEQAVDAIALYDAGGKILDVNTGSVNLLGYSKEELLQMALPDILTGEEIKQRPVQYDVLQRGESTVKQRNMRRKDGSIVETEVRSQQLPDGRFLSVIRDLTERKKAEYELDQSYKAIRKLTGHIQNVREQERGHIAREIHDELGQQLTVLKMDVSWLNKKLGNSDEAIRQKMKGLLAMLDETVKSVRRISSELRPSLLDDLGLVAAMEWQLAEFEKRAGIKTRFQVSGDDVKLPESIKTALFRIFQESLTNVARHSHAKAVSVDFSCEQDQLVLCIEDNGRGFDRQQVAEKRTLGILGMKERTSMIGGTYDISSNPGKGTVVTVMIPFNQYKPTVV